MSKATQKADVTCPMESLLRLLMGPWTPYILWILRNNGPMRFGALKRQVVGISAKVLTERLRLLEAHGLVNREHTPSIPPQVTYSLAARGVELNPALELLDSIARRWRAEDEAAAASKSADKQAA
ncbi:helix-turn-helix domain-containing protein [Ferrovibrio sp.]|uniref:winged helix-turn-helix transcriptional regulator n=1 Tax=Ferrovibrio sp. TaxID=1917215 RepID=UPI0025C01DAE|nr:helix-turn-helix domain-containing protein [Ferrovibrio sp.]MBX3453445.1 helix-turn-helix transcriptional regulator [Ferrovibrio sp.]